MTDVTKDVQETPEATPTLPTPEETTPVVEPTTPGATPPVLEPETPDETTPVVA